VYHGHTVVDMITLLSAVGSLLSFRLRSRGPHWNSMAAPKRAHWARKLSKRPVPGQFDQPSAVPSQCWFKSLFTVAETRQRAAFVPAHQPGVAHNIRCHGWRPAYVALAATAISASNLANLGCRCSELGNAEQV